MRPGEVKIFTKSGNAVRLIKPTTLKLGRVIVASWEVERVDTRKKMICPERGLVSMEDVFEDEDHKSSPLSAGQLENTKGEFSK